MRPLILLVAALSGCTSTPDLGRTAPAPGWPGPDQTDLAIDTALPGATDTAELEPAVIETATPRGERRTWTTVGEPAETDAGDLQDADTDTDMSGAA